MEPFQRADSVNGTGRNHANPGVDMSACRSALLGILIFAAWAPAARAAGFRYWDVADFSKAPKTLSATGLYTSISGAEKTLVPEARHFDVNSALWSDDAKKSRWVLLKPGTSIGFKERDDYWDYPDAAVFIKQFAIDTIPGDTTSRVLWETRLLINAKEADDATGEVSDHWYGFSYKWDADQKDARLVEGDFTGTPDSIRVWPMGAGPGKTSMMKKWIFPSQSQCNRCHRSETGMNGVHARTVLGFFTAQLNRPHPDSAGINQLEYLFRKQVLTGAKPATWDVAPRWASVYDNTASLDVRARSYLAANCSGCHGDRGNAVSAADQCFLNFDFHTMVPSMEVRHHYTSSFGLDDSSVAPFFYPRSDRGNNPKGQDSLMIIPALAVPGYPQKSVLLFRQLSRDTVPGDYDPSRSQMPPLATFEVNTDATDLLAHWIREMPAMPAPNPILALPGAVALEATLVRGLLRVSPGALKAGVRVTMAGVDGREVPLQRIAEGAYALPRGLPKGLYYIRVGKRSLLRYLL
jgi:hypothetical protein